jgi:hypothetical protein
MTPISVYLRVSACICVPTLWCHPIAGDRCFRPDLRRSGSVRRPENLGGNRQACLRTPVRDVSSPNNTPGHDGKECHGRLAYFRAWPELAPTRRQDRKASDKCQSGPGEPARSLRLPRCPPRPARRQRGPSATPRRSACSNKALAARLPPERDFVCPQPPARRRGIAHNQPPPVPGRASHDQRNAPSTICRPTRSGSGEGSAILAPWR